MEEAWNIVLSVLESPESSIIGQQKVYTTSPITIGRSDECDFIVTDPSVSRQQATLRITNDFSRVFITDQSSQGTVVSNKVVPKGLGSGFTIHDGDSIKIGSTVLRFELKLKKSLQSTFVGEIDRSFLDNPPEEQQKPVGKAEDVGPSIAAVPIVEQKKTFSPFYIAVIVICVLILVYLLFFQ